MHALPFDSIKTFAGRLALIAAVAASASSLTVVGTHSVARAASSFELVGTWPQPGQGESLQALIADNQRQHVISVSRVANALMIRFHDLNGEPIASRSFAPAIAGAGAKTSPLAYWFDEPSGRLYLVVYRDSVASVAATGHDLLVLDLRDPGKLDTAEAVVLRKPIEAFPHGWRVAGVYPDSERSRIWLAAQPYLVNAPERNYGATVAAVELQSTAGTLAAVEGPFPVPACGSLVTTRQPTAVARVGTSVFVTCSQPTAQSNPLPGPPTPPAVAEVPLEGGAPRSYFLPGAYNDGESFFDPAAGESGRLVVVASATLRPGNAVWVFDLEQRTIVGQFSSGDIRAGGIDRMRGRVYVAFAGALLVGTDRGRPLPAPPPPHGGIIPRVGSVMTIPFASRVIVPMRQENDEVLGIFVDATTDDEFTPALEPDYSAEDRKRTDAEFPQFSSAGQAFGARLKQLGGMGNLGGNLAFGTSPKFWEESGLGGVTGLKDGTRDLHFGRVADVGLSQDESSAGAIAVSPDDNTENDARVLSGGRSWPFTEGRCFVFGTGKKTSVGESPPWSAGSAAEVTCDGEARATEGTATSAAFAVPGVVSVGTAHSSVRASRADDGTVTVVSHAEARDVGLAGTVHIGRVTSTATARAHGGSTGLAGDTVPGEAVATYERAFEEVSAPGFSCGKDCDPSEVLQALTATLGLHARVELPAPRRVATPGGAHSHVWIDEWEHEHAIATTAQDPTEIQVPALRVMFVGDSTLPWRGIVEVAATEADATATHTVTMAPFDFGGELPDFDSGPPVEPSTPEPEGPAVPDFVGKQQPAGAQVLVGAKAVSSAAPIETAASPDGLAQPQSWFEQIKEGWRWFVRGSPGALALMAAVWALMGSGPFLILRRRQLRRLVATS